jgi:acetylornithine deacetylase
MDAVGLSSAERRVCRRIREDVDDLVGLVAELVSFDTTSREPGEPARDEEQLQRFLAGRLKALGADVDLWEPETTAPGNGFVPDNLDFRGRPQLVARIPGLGGGRALLLNGHIDAVPVGDESEWTSPPLKATVRDGRLYGRGVCDMKGGLACLLFATEALHHESIRLRGDLLYCANTDEESSGAGGRAVVDRGICADAGICGEPTAFDAWTVCRGTWLASARLTGRRGHAEVAMPHWREGGAVNAIERLPLVLDAVRRLREDWRNRPDHRHPLVSPGDIVPTMVRGGDWMVTYPADCSLVVDVTYLPGHVDGRGSGAAVGQEVMAAVANACSVDPWMREHPPKWEFLCDTVPAEVSRDSPIVQLALEVAAEVGRQGHVGGLDSWHDAATYTRAGIPTISFGPGGLESAHRANEYAPVADLADFSCAAALAMMRFCGT